MSSNGNSKIEYIEDFAASNVEASAINISGKNQSRINGLGDDYGLMGKFTNDNRDDVQTDEEVIVAGEKNPIIDTPDLKGTQNQKSSIQTVPSALEEFVHGMDNQKQYSNMVRDSQESRKEAFNDSGKVKMF